MTTKTCATCKWCVEPGPYAKCHAPQNNAVPETGFGGWWRYERCRSHRTDGWLVSLLMGTCGRRGRWWQPKAVSHASDCAVHNGPALPVGPCDCGDAA